MGMGLATDSILDKRGSEVLLHMGASITISDSLGHKEGARFPLGASQSAYT